MALTKFAIRYWTSTGILVSKTICDDDSQYGNITSSPGQTVFLASTVATANGQGCQTDDQCRILIGTHRGVIPRAADADRAAQIDATGNVVAIVKADPANITPAQLGLPAGHQFVVHAAAVAGDTYATGIFSRRFAICNFTTGVVQSIQVVTVGLPVAPNAVSFAVQSATAQIGDVLPIPKAPGVVTT